MNDNLVIENKKLVSIPEGCTSLVIPDGVTSIASHALRGAQGLKSISLPSSITSFDSYVFDYCPELASIHIESIEAWCKIAFPHGFYLFRYARELYVNGELVTDLVIPEGVTEIPPYAFSHCGAISSVTLPEGLEKIGYYAFDDCWNLKSVKLPSTLKSIAAGAFGRCEELEDVYIEDVAAWCNASMPEYDFRINGNPLSYARNLYVKGEPANDLVIPEGVTEIRPNAFTHFTALRSVSLPKSLQTVGEYAFWACGITSLDIPDALTRIEKGAFSGTNIKELTIPKTVKNLCMRAFSFCKKLKKLTLEPGPVIFGDEVFSNCSSLTSLILPDGFPYFGETVFDECTNVVAVMNVTDIAEWCEKAPSISKFPVRAMQNDKPIVDLVIPEGVTEIRPRAFFGCSDLRSVKIPKSVKRIGDDAFAGCPKLKSVEIPDTVESIGETSFDDIRIVTRKKSEDGFESFYLYTETPSKNALKLCGIGSFESSPCSDVERNKLVAICNKWKWIETTRSYKDYTGADWEFCVDRNDSVVEHTHKLLPCNCLVKDGEVIGFCRDGEALFISAPTYSYETETNDRYPTVTVFTRKIIRK